MNVVSSIDIIKYKTELINIQTNFLDCRNLSFYHKGSVLI